MKPGVELDSIAQHVEFPDDLKSLAHNLKCTKFLEEVQSDPSQQSDPASWLLEHWAMKNGDRKILSGALKKIGLPYLASR